MDLNKIIRILRSAGITQVGYAPVAKDVTDLVF